MHVWRAYTTMHPGHHRDGGLPKLPCAKLQLDNLFLQWLSMPECQKLVRTYCELLSKYILLDIHISRVSPRYGH